MQIKSLLKQPVRTTDHASQVLTIISGDKIAVGLTKPYYTPLGRPKHSMPETKKTSANQ
jgi:hypothetical protein